MAQRQGPHFLLIGLGSLLLALIALVGALGGPADAWLKLSEPFIGHPPPEIVGVKSAPEMSDGTYIVTLKNPALEEVLVTGYEASPFSTATAADVTDPGGEEIAVVRPIEDRPSADCMDERRVSIARPVIIKAKRSAGLLIRPWDRACLFSLRVRSDHGASKEWTGELWEEIGNVIDRSPPPAAPPPPPPPSVGDAR